MKLKLLLSFTLVLLSSIASAQKGALTGKITDNTGPLPGASIFLKGNGSGSSSDVKGEFRMSNVAAGNYTLFVKFIGYKPLEKEVTVKAGEITNLGALSLSSNENTLTEVQVNGSSSRRGSEARALNMQKESPRIVNVIAADGIGKLPDRNAGEAVQRVAGVVLERDQGEGRFISLRGLPAEWSSSSINGDRIPTAEEQTNSRSTAFDFFPTELIQFVEISKALTPDMEGDALGGNVNFITRTSPDKETFDISLGGGYNAKANGGAFSGNVLYGNRSKDDKFGFLVNGSIWNRQWATDNYEPRFAGQNIARMELRDYYGRRRTMGFNGAADYKVGKNSKIYVRGMYGSLNDNEKHYKLRLRYEKDRAEAQNIHNILKTRLFGGDLGGDFSLGTNSTLDFKISHYNNDFNYGDIPNKDFPSYYIVQYDQNKVGYTNLIGGKYAAYQVDGGDVDPNSPQTHLPGQNAVNDASKYTFSSVQMELHHINETDRVVAQVNFKNKISPDFEFKAGLKYRDKLRTERYELPTWTWDNKGGTMPAPAYTDFKLVNKPYANDYAKEFGSQFTGIFPKFMSISETDNFFNKYRANLKVDSTGSALLANGLQTGSNFDVYEKQSAGYAMGTWKASEELTVIGGVRVENTDLKVSGWLYEAVAGQPNYRGKLTPQTKRNSYTTLLPMLHLKYSPNDHLNVRIAATKTFARPDFGSLVAGGTYTPQDNKFIYGNPTIKPVKSYNLDLMTEYYFGNVGAITAGAFYKSVKDPIFSDSKFYAEFNGKQDARVVQDQNGADARVAGFELGLSKKLDFLPGLLGGLGINANYTFIRSRMTIPDRTEKVRIPGQANNLFNLALFYENKALQARVALNHKGSNIVAHGSTANADEYFGKNTSMDANLSYRISPKLMLFAEANNLLNTEYRYYFGVPERPSQVERYGIRGQVGVKLSL